MATVTEYLGARNCGCNVSRLSLVQLNVRVSVRVLKGNTWQIAEDSPSAALGCVQLNTVLYG